MELSRWHREGDQQLRLDRCAVLRRVSEMGVASEGSLDAADFSAERHGLTEEFMDLLCRVFEVLEQDVEQHLKAAGDRAGVVFQ
ncbi:hypothetical protein CAP37_03860 [Hydrogenophaga sp. IBVHS1]|nr:hypothetical protein CAP37_03860 [Hydrogenophaga sp. IBVHS1]